MASKDNKVKVERRACSSARAASWRLLPPAWVAPPPGITLIADTQEHENKGTRRDDRAPIVHRGDALDLSCRDEWLRFMDVMTSTPSWLGAIVQYPAYWRAKRRELALELFRNRLPRAKRCSMKLGRCKECGKTRIGRDA
jgi:hypothetical protein